MRHYRLAPVPVRGRRGWSRRSWRDVVEAIATPIIGLGCIVEIVVGIPVLAVMLGIPLK